MNTTASIIAIAAFAGLSSIANRAQAQSAPIPLPPVVARQAAEMSELPEPVAGRGNSPQLPPQSAIAPSRFELSPYETVPPPAATASRPGPVVQGVKNLLHQVRQSLANVYVENQRCKPCQNDFVRQWSRPGHGAFSD
jgi:hypothetical protein